MQSLQFDWLLKEMDNDFLQFDWLLVVMHDVWLMLVLRYWAQSQVSSSKPVAKSDRFSTHLKFGSPLWQNLSPKWPIAAPSRPTCRHMTDFQPPWENMPLPDPNSSGQTCHQSWPIFNLLRTWGSSPTLGATLLRFHPHLLLWDLKTTSRTQESANLQPCPHARENQLLPT